MCVIVNRSTDTEWGNHSQSVVFLLMLECHYLLIQLSNSESRGISSPDHAVGSSSSSQCAVDSLSGAQPYAPGPCSPLSSALSSELADPTNLVSYYQINRILREAHFESLQCRGHPRDAWWFPPIPAMPLGQERTDHNLGMPGALHGGSLTQLYYPSTSPVSITSQQLYAVCISLDGD